MSDRGATSSGGCTTSRGAPTSTCPVAADFRALEPGLTSVLRVKNEARSLPWVLPPLFRAVQQVVVVDNQSDDGTPEVARAVAERGWRRATG